jgi:thiol-disulfide isomerase/thioredoxin
MAGVIAAAVSRGPSLETLAIALAYGVGAAIPLVAIGSWGRAVARRLGRLARGATERAAGALLLAGALAIAIGIDAPIQQTASSLLPDGWTAALYAIETQTAIQEELRHMDITPAARAALPDLGAAPELRGIADWINSEPLSLEQLRGSVVLVHFWTFGCINCQNVQPYVKAWYARYHDQGFAVIGVHTPELSFERDIANVRAAVASKGVTFPVAFDPKFATWNAYRNGLLLRRQEWARPLRALRRRRVRTVRARDPGAARRGYIARGTSRRRKRPPAIRTGATETVVKLRHCFGDRTFTAAG